MMIFVLVQKVVIAMVVIWPRRASCQASRRHATHCGQTRPCFRGEENLRLANHEARDDANIGALGAVL